MKKYFGRKPMIITFICTALLLVSCSKDDDSATSQAPNAFNLIDVPDGATDIGLQPQLTWEAATDPDGDQVSYQVFLDTQNPPQTSIANNLGMNVLSIEEVLQPETTYYWKVIAEDTNGNTTESDISSFITRNMTNAEAIIGKWFYESIAGQPPLTACRKNTFLLFTAELFLQIEGYGEDSNGDCTSSFGTATYEVVGDQIEILSNGNTVTFGIESLTDTELVLDTGSEVITLLKE